jgi:hypothetical protein
MLLGTLVALAAVPLYLALGDSLGVRGLALAPAIGMSVNALATLLWARWLHGAPALGALAATTARAGLIAAAAAVLVGWGLPRQFASTSGALLGLGLGGAAYAGLVGLGAFTVGDRVLREVLTRMLRRVRR